MERAKYKLMAQEFPLRDYWISMGNACRRFCLTSTSERLAIKDKARSEEHAIRLKAVRHRLLRLKYETSNQMTASVAQEKHAPAEATVTAAASTVVTQSDTPQRGDDSAPIGAKSTLVCRQKRQTVKGESHQHLQRKHNRHIKSRYYLPNLKSLLRSPSSILSILLFIFIALASKHHNVVIAQSYNDLGAAATQPLGQDPITTSQQHQQQHQQQQQQTGQVAESSPQASTTAANQAACFGGLQTFEKISMSTFENPAGASASGSPGSSTGSSFGSGILIQQDDQALTSECINLCRSQSNCLSFVIDYNKFECKSYATTQQELQQEFAAKFQSARSTSPTNQTGESSDLATGNGGYQTAASSSQANLQQLLPSASSNYFEKICLDGVANRNQFSDVCGQGRLWTVERVVDSFLDGFVEKEVTNVNNKDECSKLCIFETQFVCRSADYDQHSRLCRLSKEDRRTQPQAMRYVANSNRQYLENQCATPGPSSCVYETKRNVGIISMDALKFAQTAQDCQMKCNQETTFNCRSYSFHQQRCFLSGDDSVSLNSNLIKLPVKQGWTFGEKRCLVELCTKGIFSYEKITGFTLRSALSTSIDLMVPSSSSQLGLSLGAGGNNLAENLHQESSQTRLRHLLPVTFNQSASLSASSSSSSSSSLASAMMMLMSAASSDLNQRYADPLQESASTVTNGRRQTRGANNLAITEHCRHSCDLGYLNCPAFTIDYKNNRCQRLDRNSQGRHHELVARDGFAYYEKICLRVPEIMSMCQDKYWIFERVIGYELAPRLYDKSLKFVQSRRDCEEYCLEEKQFQCRSALYNDETSDCKLSRYNRRLAIQEGGYYRNFNVRISYLENNCLRDHQLERRQCYYEQAKEEPSYPTFTERIEMATPTQHPSPSSEMSEPRGNATHRYGASFCEQLCNDNSKFECHSFGYYASTAQCFLSADDSISAGEMATTPSTGFTYYEKKCRLMQANANGSSNNATFENEPDQRGGGAGGSGIGTIISSTPSSNFQNPYFQPPMQHHQATNSAGSGTGANPTTPTSENGGFTTTTGPQDIGGQTTTVTHNNSHINIHIDQHLNAARPSAHLPSRSQAGGLQPNSNSTLGMDPDLYKCGVGHTYVYQRISGFEPIGGYLTLLIKNNDRPGIVAECADLCKRAFECRAFVVDYESNQCFAMLENSSVGLLSLRQTLGKDYFEGFCLANHLLLTGSNCRNKTWVMDKIVDQAVVGVQHQRLIPDSDRLQCRQACFEERLFWCKSAMFDSATGDCKLYSVDRESMPQMRLLFTKGVDFFENQCQISSSSCPYDAIERDMTIITITKSVQARSTFDCELACNMETSFNCRSYTYMDQYPSLPNLCLLSSDSRSTSQRGSVKEHQKTLYAERNCYYRKPRYPGGGGGIGGRYEPPSAGHSSPASSLSPPLNSMDPYTGRAPATHQDPLDGGQRDNRYAPLPLPAAPMIPGAPLPPRLATEQEAVNPYDSVGPTLGLGCEPHQFTFERTFGYDYKLAPKERASIAPTIGIAIGCQQECLRRGEKCQSFVVEYALPYQSCFLIETQAGANKKLLVKSPNSAYFEKVCLPRTGLQEPSPPTLGQEPLTHAPMSSNQQPLDGPQSMDISPSYSQEPWSPQVPNQLPYYLQQQQLVQNYPSRACSKLWSFERFVNHNFTAPVDRMIENSLNRAHCETQCLNEASFSCRAATYDYANKICRLFKNTRRTILSQFVDLESGSAQQTTMSTQATAPSLPDSHPGTAHVISGESLPGGGESIQTSASSLQSNSLGGDVTRRQSGARQLTSGPMQTAEASNSAKNIDYLENTCTPEPSSCQYRQIYDQFSPYIDKVNHAVSLGDCQRQCDQERLFSCKSINYDPISRNCMLVVEDLISLNRGQQNSLLPKKNTIYSEKGNCEMISVQCNSQEMLVSINFDSPFRGRVMAKGNPEQCYMLGDGQTNVQFSIVFGPKCNSRQEGHNTFVNEVVIQQHPVIMTESDKTVRVMCAFEAPDQTITLKNPMSRDNKTGIDVGTPETSRTRHDKQQFNSVVSNKAAPPSVLLRILDPAGRDASMINLGDDLMLKIQMQMDGMKNSALGIFARNLAARSSNGESLLLIDNDGCPVDPQVFPALEIDPKDGKSLVSTFKAFRFPSSGLVNFEVQIRFCPERCQPVDCHKSGQRARSFGRRRKRQADDMQALLESKRAPILQSVSSADQQTNQAPLANLDALSTVMKPGKAFEYVRKLMLPPTETPQTETASATESILAPNQAEYPTTATTDINMANNQDANRDTAPMPSFVPENQPISEEFDNHAAAVTKVVEVSQASPAPTAQPVGENESSSQENQPMQETFADQPTNSGESSPNPSQDQVNSLSQAQKSILMHIDEKVVPPNDFSITRGINIHPQTLAPYGRFPPPTAIDEMPLASKQPDVVNHQASLGLTVDHSSAPGHFNQPDAPGVDPAEIYVDKRGSSPATVGEQQLETTTSSGFQPIDPPHNHMPSRQRPMTGQSANHKDMPLRFSILVGENQVPTNGRPTPDQPSVLIMNSTSMDLDHIVIPGKKGQLDDGGSSEQSNSIATPHLSGNNGQDSSSNYPQSTEHESSSRHRHPNELLSKRNASYEQTFDALPSNSIPSEIHLNQIGSHQHDRHANHRLHNKMSAANVSPSSESAASHDCQIEAGRSRLRTIIWTGGIVIALNICLVILSLVLYFKKVHLRQNHTIVRSSSDCGTNRRSEEGGGSGGGRWPSVILKSKNKLGTSLNAHEHFFCKLNSNNSSNPTGIEHDFNWPNLSSSSSRSTVSSLASPVPSTSIRVNQMRPSLKSAPFDAHSTLRSGNFSTGHSKGTASMMDETDHRDEFVARYTNNIDILHSERF